MKRFLQEVVMNFNQCEYIIALTNIALIFCIKNDEVEIETEKSYK